MATEIWSQAELVNWMSHGGSGANALAFYRSDWGAITVDPNWMSVPVDDHLVHRGDGVFETLLCEENALYNLEAHLKRLRASAAAIHLEVPWSDIELNAILKDTFRAAGQPRCLGRILVGRGRGGFSVDPAESTGPLLYVIVYPAKPPFMDSHPGGARLITSRIPPKSGGLATIKTCNYIPNALARREANEQGVDFAIGVDADGFLTESFTENIATIPAEGVLQIPPPTHHLAGTTLARLAELMRQSGWSVQEKPLRPQELFNQQETLIVGTTAYVTQAVELDSRPLPTGPRAAFWLQALREDIASNPDMRAELNGKD
jgi:branched-chain amino acid aminotransferase